MTYNKKCVRAFSLGALLLCGWWWLTSGKASATGQVPKTGAPRQDDELSDEDAPSTPLEYSECGDSVPSTPVATVRKQCFAQWHELHQVHRISDSDRPQTPTMNSSTALTYETVVQSPPTPTNTDSYGEYPEHSNALEQSDTGNSVVVIDAPTDS